MSYKTILVHLDTSRRAPLRFDLALKLAAAHGAHLIGLFAPFLPDTNSFYAVAAVPAFFEDQDRLRLEQCATLEQLFRTATAREDVAGEWRTTDGYANRAVPLHARHADLVIAGQFDADGPDSYVADHFCENLVLSSGRPTLFVPYAGSFPTLGANVLVGWDGSREATRAVHDALPLLKRAARVTVVTANAIDNGNGEPAERIPGVDIATVIARHGVTVETLDIEGASRLNIGELLLSQASDLGADLIVTGAYAHTRWRELILGGVTRTLLNAMTIPVLMSH